MPELTDTQWLEIEDLYSETETPLLTISKRFDVSRAMIRKKAKQRGWRRPVGPYTDAVKLTDTSRRISDPQTSGDHRIIAFGKRTGDNMERILEMVREGTPPNVAAQSVGIHPNTLKLWQSEDAEFAALAAQARADFLHDKAVTVNRISKSDGKLALNILERSPETREYYGTGHGVGGGMGGSSITVTINVPIPQIVEVGQSPVIDVVADVIVEDDRTAHDDEASTLEEV